MFFENTCIANIDFQIKKSDNSNFEFTYKYSENVHNNIIFRFIFIFKHITWLG